MFAALADQPGEVRLDSLAPLGGFAPTGWQRSKVAHLSGQVAALVSKHGLHIVTEAGRVFLRNIAMAFDSYLHQQATDKPRYSRTI